MPQRRIHLLSATGVVPAPAERVYGLIADYRNGHPRIVPKQFSNLVVEQGGVGAGTVFRFQMRLLGITQSFRAAITEPDPGRVLVETDLDANGAVTTFRVEPEKEAQSRVTITTELPIHGGLIGAIERWVTNTLLLPLYSEEITILSSVAAS